MAIRIHPRQRYSLRHHLLCSALAVTVGLVQTQGLQAAPLSQVMQYDNPFTATLQGYLAQEPTRFNDKMWELIRANPENKELIFSEAIRLSLQHEIALRPNNRVAILAKFKKLYPQYADQLDAYAMADMPVKKVYSFDERTTTPRVFADDPEVAEVASGHTSWMGRNWPWVLLGGVAVGGVAVAIAATSGDDDGDDAAPAAPLANPPTVTETEEYNNQSGLSRIFAGGANAAGYTGQDIIVGVIDSGVNTLHPDLRDNIATGGYDFVTNSSNVVDHDTSSAHGTHVAGIIAAARNNFGMRGVAYNAKILPLAAIDPGADADGVQRAVVQAQTNGAKIINASYGPSDLATELFVDNGAQFFWNRALREADRYLEFANSGGILVFAAGNEYTSATTSITNNPTGGGFLPFIRPSNSAIALGQPGAYRASEDGVTLTTLNADYSGLEGNLLAVVALNNDNTIASFSNRCGVTKNWCIAAPGVDINSTSVGNTYSELSGTSFAAPHVSGALAVLLQQHPELTPEQVVNLLLTTAIDLGDAGVDDIYGYGLVNLNAAVQSTGPFMVVTGTNMNGHQTLLTSSTIQASPAFGNSFANTLAATKVGVLDAYTKNYKVALGSLVQPRLAQVDTTAALQRFGQPEFRPGVAIDDANSISFTLKAKDGVERVAGETNPGSSIASYSFTHRATDDVAVNMNHRDIRANALGFTEDDRGLLATQVSANGVGNPYLDFVGSGYASNITLDMPWSGRFRATTAMGGTEEDAGQSNMLAMAEIGFGDKQNNINLTAGALIEQDQVLGMKGDGAFAFGQGTSTWFAGLTGHWQLAPQTVLAASFYGGVTQAEGGNNSLVQSVGTVSSSAWRVGLTQNNVWQEDDRLRFNIAQPLRAEGGNLNLNLPQYRLRDGSIVSQQVDYALAPSGREIDVEAGYSFALDAQSRLDVAAMYRRDAGHVAGKDDALVLTRFNRGF